MWVSGGGLKRVWVRGGGLRRVCKLLLYISRRVCLFFSYFTIREVKLIANIAGFNCTLIKELLSLLTSQLTFQC